MNGFRADARAFAAILGLVLIGGFLTAAAAAEPERLAQAGPPVRLTPPTSTSPDESPAAAPAAPVPPPATDLPAAPVEPTEGSKSAIEVTQPPPVDTESVGLMDPAQAGLPATLWQGSARALIERVIDDLPDATVSRPARGLARRLLTVAARAPTGDGAVKGRSFVGTRAAKLLAMGDIEDAAGLARLIPGRAGDEALARLQLDSVLVAYDSAGACSVVRAQIARFNTFYWQKALIFCQLLANEHSRAQLGVSLLHEQPQATEDAAFDRLVAKLSGDTRATVDKLPDATPLHLAMMRVANLPLPADLGTSVNPLVLRMVATSPNASAELRLIAAERAEAYGALPTEDLAALYDAVAFTPEQLSNPLAVAQSDRGPRGRAALHRGAKMAPAGAGRAELLQRSWRLARERGGYATAVRVDVPALLELQPDHDLMFFAADATRALLLAGKLEEAQRWYMLVRTEAVSNNDLAVNAEALLSPLFWLADPAERKANTPPLAARFQAWKKAEETVDAAGLPQHAALLVTLLTSTGDAPDPILIEPLLQAKSRRDTVTMPNMGLWLGLGAAFDAGHVGETALFSLATLGPEGAAGAAPQTTALVLDALRAASLDTDARAIAVETAIAGGL